MEFLDDIPKFTEDILIVPIRSHLHEHWVNNNISFFYIFDLESSQEFILNFKHNDCDQVKFINQIFTNKNQFVYNKKDLIGIEAKCLIWLQNNEIQNHQFDTKVKFLHNKYHIS